MNPVPLSHISAALAHIERLLEGSRVLVVGQATTSVGRHLLERGARLVQVLDADGRRVAQAAANNSEPRLTFAQLTPAGLRDGSFDLVVVEDLSSHEDLPTVIGGVRRSLSSTGIALFCSENSEEHSGLLGRVRKGLSFDELSDGLWDDFEQIVFLGQAPFVGYSLVQLGLEEAPEPTLDNAYLGGEAEDADFFLALCTNSELPLEVDEMTIVQLPAAKVLAESENQHRALEQRAAVHLERLESELEDLRSRNSEPKLSALTAELEERDKWIHSLERRAKEAETRADDSQAEMDEVEQELENTHAALLHARQDADRAVQERDAALSKLARLEKELEQARGSASEAAHQEAGREALEEELTALHADGEQQLERLAEQEEQIAKLERRVEAQDVELDELHRQLDETEEFLRDAEEESRLWEQKAHAAKREAEQKAHAAQGEVEQKGHDAHGETDVTEDVVRLEEQLKERGKRLVELESQLRQLEAYARTLKVEAAEPTAGEDPERDREFDELSRALAEREAELVAAEWTIGQLRRSSGQS